MLSKRGQGRGPLWVTWMMFLIAVRGVAATNIVGPCMFTTRKVSSSSHPCLQLHTTQHTAVGFSPNTLSVRVFDGSAVPLGSAVNIVSVTTSTRGAPWIMLPTLYDALFINRGCNKDCAINQYYYRDFERVVILHPLRLQQWLRNQSIILPRFWKGGDLAPDANPWTQNRVYDLADIQFCPSWRTILAVFEDHHNTSHDLVSLVTTKTWWLSPCELGTSECNIFPSHSLRVT